MLDDAHISNSCLFQKAARKGICAPDELVSSDKVEEDTKEGDHENAECHEIGNGESTGKLISTGERWSPAKRRSQSPYRGSNYSIEKFSDTIQQVKANMMKNHLIYN